MPNRFTQHIRFFVRAWWLVLTGFAVNDVVAQSGPFIFSYPGPDTLLVGPTCAVMLQGNIGTPVVTPTWPGASVTVSHFDTLASGFLPSDLFTDGLAVVVDWYVEDNFGHPGYFTFVVHTRDKTPPVFDLTGIPNSVIYQSIVQVPPPPNIPVSDNCSPTPQIITTYSQTTPPDTCLAGSYTRTWTAKDVAGNVAVFNQTITITADNLPPVIASFPQNGASLCSQVQSTYPAWLSAQMAAFTATDPSGIKDYYHTGPAMLPPGCKMPVTVTFWARDNCNLTVPASATFTTNDNAPPVIITPPQDTLVYCAPNGNHLTELGKWIQNHGYLSAMDSCTESNLLTYEMRVNGLPRDSAQVVSIFLASYLNGCTTQLVGGIPYTKVRGKIQVEFYVKDACGNSTFAGPAEFGVRDTLPPVITGINQTEQCGGGNDQTVLQNWINAHGNALLSDDCSASAWTDFSWTSSLGNVGSGTFDVGPFPAIPAHQCNWYVDVTFRATDDCGNIGAETLRFQIQDTQAPVIAGLPALDTLDCSNPTPTLPGSFISDNCDTSMVIGFTALNFDTVCNGSYKRLITWSATDDCGNIGTATQIIQVLDTQAPVITQTPGPITIACDTFVLPAFPVLGAGVTASDNCSLLGSLTVTDDFSGKNPDPAQCAHYTYPIIRTFTVSDQCGNTRTATQVISVVDNKGPVLSGFSDTTFVCEAVMLTPSPSGLDACSGPTTTPILVSDIVSAMSCTDAFTRTLSWRATDVCGNTGTFTQQIHVIDTVPPALGGIPANITVACNNIPPPPATTTFFRTDNCDTDVAISFAESEIRDPDIMACAHWTDYIVVREWTATDNCGNTQRYTQQITVEDKIGPVIVAVQPMNLPTDPDVCGASVMIPAPASLYDDCTAQIQNVVMLDTVPFTVSGGDPLNTPVDTVFVQFFAPNTAPAQPALGPATLTIFLDNADAEAMQEFFRIYGEGGVFIGQTDPTPVSCGSNVKSFTLSAYQTNLWLSDGVVNLTLAPNGAGSSAINLFCSMPRVRAQLSYQYANPYVPISVTYSLGGPAQAFPPSGPVFLETGTHTVTYTASDCAGNTTTTTTTISVVDLQAPDITAPLDFTAYVPANACSTMVTLPFPLIAENCAFSGNITQASAVLPVAFFDEPNAGVIPQDINMTVTGLIPNAVSGGILKIRHRGDNGDPGEFFNLFDENNMPVDQTDNGPAAGECVTFYEKNIPVTALQINSWAANGGVATFRAEANRDVINFSDFISPCAALAGDQTDGISRIQAVLIYDFAVVTYVVRNGAQIIQSGSLIGNETTVTLPPGVYTVEYLVSDNSGLEAVAEYTISVQDTIRPTASCKNTIIQTHLSGLVGTTVPVGAINNNSTDNCTGALTYALAPNTFNCAQATPPNNLYNVTLTVTDVHGNTATCIGQVRVEKDPPDPYYDAVCEGGTLNIYSNADTLLNYNNTDIYSFNWSTPGGGMPTTENLTFLNAQNSAEGPYTVTVTGFTGCTASATVVVDLTNLPIIPVIVVNPPPVCFGDSIHLSTPTYNGQNVNYQWYRLTMSGPILLGTTTVPFFVIPQPAVGTYQYFVKVSADGCLSLDSQPKTVTVNARPVATVEPPLIDICQGETAIFGTPTAGDSYAWVGPGGYASGLQFPPAIANAQLSDTGFYCVRVSLNGCTSLPVCTRLNVRPKPATPSINGANAVCEGASITLIAFPNQSSMFVWEDPTGTQDTTVGNFINLNNLTLGDAGNYRVRQIENGCSSDYSAPFLLQVEAFPQVAAMANINLCQDDTLFLSASSTPALSDWRWNGPAGFTAFSQNAPRIPAVSGIYQVIGKTFNGCADTASINVQVIAPPTINTLGHNAPPCPDGTTDAVISATVSSPNLPLSYAWYFNGGLMPISVEPNLVIPDVAADDNGSYTLVVTDAFGCSSEPVTTVISVSNPLPTPLLNITPFDGTVCVGESATFSVANANQFTGSLVYFWIDPQGDTLQTSGPSLTIPNTTLGDIGLYKVRIKADTCLSPISAPISLTVYPIPPVPTPNSNSPLCEGDTLRLWVANPILGGQYVWNGPGAWGSSEQEPKRPNALDNANFEGAYYVKVSVNGCMAGPGEPEIVQVFKRPKKPIIALPTPANICRDNPGTALALQLEPNSIQVGATYTWIHVASGDTVGGPSLNTSFSTLDLSQFPPGPNAFYVTARINICQEVSLPVTVVIDTIPQNVAFAGKDTVLCTSQQLVLNAGLPNGVTGQWTQPAGQNLSIIDPGNPQSQVNGVLADSIYIFFWSLSNGGCLNYDADTVAVRTVEPEQAMLVEDIVTLCPGDAAVIEAEQGQSVAGYWSQPINQEVQLNIGITDSINPLTSVTNLVPGNAYLFYWNLPDIGCGPSSATVTVYNYSAKPYAGADRPVCSTDSCANLDATLITTSFETGLWSSDNPGLIFNPPNASATTVCRLVPGPNTIFWTTNSGQCGNNSRDTVVIFFQQFPIAVTDSYMVGYGQEITFNVLSNDVLPANYTVAIKSMPLHGSLDTLNLGQYVYLADAGYSGTDQFIYEICNPLCPEACSSAIVQFTIGESDGCPIPTLITPNNDRTNDLFTIPCLSSEGVNESEVTIFNIHGDQVFHAKPYLNDWDGTYNGNPLPAGTYYWVVQITPSDPARAGFLIIQR